MNNQILVVFEMTFFMIFSKMFFKNLYFKKFQYIEDRSPVVGFCEGTLKGFESCL